MYLCPWLIRSMRPQVCVGFDIYEIVLISYTVCCLVLLFFVLLLYFLMLVMQERSCRIVVVLNLVEKLLLVCMFRVSFCDLKVALLFLINCTFLFMQL